jgi:hypothetical protein
LGLERNEAEMRRTFQRWMRVVILPDSLHG